jgi:hypothetical protein
MRCRLCISASHTREDLDRAILAIDEVSELVGCKYALPFPFRKHPLKL